MSCGPPDSATANPSRAQRDEGSAGSAWDRTGLEQAPLRALKQLPRWFRRRVCRAEVADAVFGLVVALTERCARALHRAVLSESLERTAQRAWSALELTAALSAAATPGELANAASQAELAAIGAAAVHLFWRRGGERLALVASIGDGGPCGGPGDGMLHARLLVAEAERTGMPVWSAEFVAVPFAVSRSNIAVVGIRHAHPRALGGNDRTLFLAIAAACGQALHRAMLASAEAESRRRAEMAEALAKRTLRRIALADRIAAALAEARTETEATWIVFDEAAEVLAAVAGVVTRRTVEDEVEVVHRFGCPEDVPRGPHAEVLRTGRPLWLPGRSELSSRFPEAVSALRLRGGATWIAVPLWLDEEPSGTLSLTFPSAPTDDEGRGSLLRLVGQCGQAIFRARLADAERAMRRAAEAAEAAEAETRRLGKLQEELVAVVAHDLRTPLTAIQFSLKTLFAAAAPTEAQRRKVARVSESVGHIGEIVDTLRDLTRARLAGGIPLEMERVDLGSIARRAVAETEGAHRGRRVRLSIKGDLTGLGDRARLLQVLSNLIDNAVQHGSVEAPVQVAVRGEGPAIVIAVHNAGPPIPPPLLPCLFEPFRQGDASLRRAKRTGSMGLGLFIVREIVQAHGGKVAVDSGLERGTTFTVLLPRLPTFSKPAGDCVHAP